MKGPNENKSWQMILDAMEDIKNMGELKQRWNEIKHHQDDGKKDDTNEGKKKGKGKDKTAKTEEWIRQQKEEGQKRKAAEKAAEKGEEVKVHTHKTIRLRFDGANGKQDDDDKKSTKSGKAKKPSSTPNPLKKWADEYDKNKGQVLASRHFDRTGVRITAKEALRMAAEE